MCSDENLAQARVPAKILLLEDERNVGSTLVERLVQEGFEMDWSQTISEAKLHLNQKRFDLAILDVGVPDGSGFTVAKHLREFHRDTAIVFLTARGTSEDRVKGLELGAEDYIVKPFHFKELLLRIKNSLKRAGYLKMLTASEEIKIGKACIRFSKFEIFEGGVQHRLTHKECALLRLLVERSGHVVSRDEILNQVWSDNEFPTTRTVDNFIMRLRKLIEDDPNHPKIIKTVRGVGYQMVKGN